MNLTDGIMRVRYRDSWQKPQMMKPGGIYPITIEAFPTSNLFKQGHRIRVDISSSNFPHFDTNPNSGEAEGHAERPRVATNRVHIDSGVAVACCAARSFPRARSQSECESHSISSTWIIDFARLI